jgi:hypothetical protein
MKGFGDLLEITPQFLVHNKREMGWSVCAHNFSKGKGREAEFASDCTLFATEVIPQRYLISKVDNCCHLSHDRAKFFSLAASPYIISRQMSWLILSQHNMSAPQIPNLLTLRGGPRSKGRGRGRGTDRGGGPSTPARQRHDLHIQSTDTDAAVSRLSAVSLGYLDDPFASYFVGSQGTRRLPIINRGL